MPDFERVNRDFGIYLAKDEQAKRELIAYHRGLDTARWEMVVVSAIVAGLVIGAKWLTM